MAVQMTKCLGVDIGSHSVRVAQMEMLKAGPRVVALHEEKLEFEPGLTEPQKYQQIVKQLSDLLKRNKIREKSAVFCVPGQTVFMRRFQIPRATPERLERMIKYEARQQIPFPLEQTFMEWQICDEEDVAQVNVLLVAIKKDFVNQFMRVLINKTGLTPVSIAVSTLSLYNFQEINLSDRALGSQKKKPKKAKDDKPLKKQAKKGGLLGKKKKKGEQSEEPDADELVDFDADSGDAMDDIGFEEIQAYVNVGHSLMDIAIPRSGKMNMLGFSRSVPLGGHHMDLKIAEALGIEDPAQARKIKESNVAVLSMDFEMEGADSKVNMEASQAVTKVADRLVAELRRSLDFYISQPDGVAVDSIVLSGGLARLPYFTTYIEEKMGMPVTLAEPHNENLRMPDPLPANFSDFAVSIGLALQGLGLARHHINFLPEDRKSVQELKGKRLPEVVAMAAMLLVIVGLSYGVGEKSIREYELQQQAITSKIRQYSEVNTQVQVATEQHRKMSEAYTSLSEASGFRDFWFNFLREFSAKRGGDIMVEELHLRMDGNVLVRGYARTPAVITQFISGLREVWGGVLVWQAKITDGPTLVNDRRFPTQMYGYELSLKTLVRSNRVRLFGGWDPPPEEVRPDRNVRQNRPGRPTAPRGR